MRGDRVSRAVGITLVLISTLSFLFSFQAGQKQKPIHHEVSVTLKLIQVYVTGKDGKPVKDLRLEDFTLADNGKTQKITDFERHEWAVRPETVAVDEPKPASPLEANEPPRLNRKFFILLDFYRNDVTGIKRSKRAARHFIETQLHPSDEVSVLSYNPYRGLTVHEYLARDPARALAAIDRLRFVPGWGEDVDPQAENPLGGAEPEIGLEGSGVGTESELARASSFNNVLRKFAQSLRTIEGFKSIIFFSWGFARSFIYDAAANPDYPYGNQVMDQYQAMIREFAASNCQVYAVNSEGIGALAKDAGARGTAALQDLSKLSGGKYFYNVAQYEKIAQAIQDITSHYYVLGYPIAETWDGSYHEVRVSVNRKGCDVYAQSGYYSPKPFGEYTEFEKKIHLVNLAVNERPRSGTAAPISLAALPCAPGKTDNTLILAEIPASMLSDLGGAKTEIVSAVFDAGNQVVEFNRGEMEIRTAAGQSTIYSSMSSLPPGKYKSRLVLRNPQTGRAARGESSFELLEPRKSGLAAFPPLIVIPGKHPIYVRGTGKKPGRESGEEVSLKSLYPLIPRDGVPCAGDVPEKAAEIWTIVRCLVPERLAPSLKMDFFIMPVGAEAGNPVTHRLVKGKVNGNIGIFLFEVDMAGLSTGSYVLVVVLTDERTGEHTSAERTFRVVAAVLD